jgi:hypothetical protein
MLRGLARAAAVAVLCGALLAIRTPAAAQHEHHGVPAGGAQVLLTGTARCAEGTPLGGAIVQLFHGSGPGRHLVAASAADAAGRFAVRTGGGTYTLEISYPGHEPHRREVTLATAPLSVGNVRLQFRALVLDELTASAERAAVQLRSGATVVHTRASAAAGGGIAELLRTVPGVEVDADGRISMRGSTSVLVLMNGRRIPLSGDALAAFLRQMPATALERIEAGTTASARQDADGAAGVVNLVFRDDAARRTAMRSLAGSLATEDHYMGSAAASGDVGGVVSWDAMYSSSATRPRTESKTARWSLVPGDLPLQTAEDSRARATHRLHSVMAGAAVTPGPNTSLALRGTYSWMEGSYRNSTAFLFTDAAGNTASGAIGSLVRHVIPSGELSAAATVDRGSVRFASEARTSFVDEDLRGDHDEGAGYRYMSQPSWPRASASASCGTTSACACRASAWTSGRNRGSAPRAAGTRCDPLRRDCCRRSYRYETDVHAGYLAARRSIGGVRARRGCVGGGPDRASGWTPPARGPRCASSPASAANGPDARRPSCYRSRTAAASTGRARRC